MFRRLPFFIYGCCRVFQPSGNTSGQLSRPGRAGPSMIVSLIRRAVFMMPVVMSPVRIVAMLISSGCRRWRRRRRVGVSGATVIVIQVLASLRWRCEISRWILPSRMPSIRWRRWRRRWRWRRREITLPARMPSVRWWRKWWIGVSGPTVIMIPVLASLRRRRKISRRILSSRMPSIRWWRGRRRAAGHVARMTAEPAAVLHEPVVPVPAVIPAVLDISVSPQIRPAVPPDEDRKVIIRNMVPWPVVIPGVVPHPIPVKVIVVVIKNHVVRASPRHIKTGVGKVDEIRPDIDDNFRYSS
jgi:hypothetical protein